MITERTLRKWRREALVLEGALLPEKSESGYDLTPMVKFQAREYVNRTLRMTQELLDNHLRSRPSR